VTLALLHGAAPAALVLCHEHGREQVRDRELEIPPLAELVRAYESAAAWVNPARVAGISLNTRSTPEPEARQAVAAASRATGLPATDPVRFGIDPLAEAVVRLANGRRRATHA
jgi:uncharacterized NAD-dependent epimerase/dehydratase family protein